MLRPPVNLEVRMGGFSYKAKLRLMLPIMLCHGQVSHSLQALIDSAAEQNLIDFVLAKRLHLPLEMLDPPIPVTALNNQVFAHITHQVGPVTLLTSGNHRKTITLFAFPSPDSLLILGFPWHQKHNHHIDWSGNTVANWSLFCLAHCLTSALPPKSPEASSTETCNLVRHSPLAGCLTSLSLKESLWRSIYMNY